MPREDDQRRALVAGATRGIGKATAVALGRGRVGRRRDRAHWSGPGRGRDHADTGQGQPLPGSLEETGALVRAGGVRTLELVAGPARPRHAFSRAAAQVIHSWGGVDLLVNNAVDTGDGSMVTILDLHGGAGGGQARRPRGRPGDPGADGAARDGGAGGRHHRRRHVPQRHRRPPGAGGEGGLGAGATWRRSSAAFHRIAPPGGVVELGDRGSGSLQMDPGYVETERQQVNAVALGLEGRYTGAPPSVPAAAIVWLAEHAGEIENGQTVRAQKLALTHELHADWRPDR